MPQRFATVKREDVDRLAIEMHYVLGAEENRAFRGFSIRWINRPESLYDVPFDVWEQFVGETVSFARFQGSGQGMVGGPTKTRVGGSGHNWLYEGVLSASRLMFTSVREEPEEVERQVRAEMAKFTHVLQDDSYEFSPDMVRQIERLVENGRLFWKKVQSLEMSQRNSP